MSVSDNFNRADSGSLGGNWTELVNGLQVSSNGAYGVNAATYQLAYWSANSWNNDQSSQVDQVVQVDNNSGVIVRASAGPNCYLAMARFGTRIYRVDAGALTLLADLGGTFTGGDTLKLVATGTTLELFKNGVSQGTATDATYASGSAGIYSHDNVSGGDKLDNWVGTGEIVAAAADNLPWFVRPTVIEYVLDEITIQELVFSNNSLGGPGGGGPGGDNA